VLSANRSARPSKREKRINMQQSGQPLQRYVSDHYRCKASFLACLTVLLSVALTQASNAQEFVWGPNFPVGTAIPDLSSQDQTGAVRDYDSIRGHRGMIFLISRSFDW
jgi:hypothetical protein